jgi:hypothetical protein
MRTKHNWAIRMLRTIAILACILAPVFAIASEPSANKQLMQAAEEGTLEQVKDLPAKGGDVNAKDKSGRTALSLASAKKRSEIAQYLKARGAK